MVDDTCRIVYLRAEPERKADYEKSLAVSGRSMPATVTFGLTAPAFRNPSFIAGNYNTKEGLQTDVNFSLIVHSLLL